MLVVDAATWQRLLEFCHASIRDLCATESNLCIWGNALIIPSIRPKSSSDTYGLAKKLTVAMLLKKSSPSTFRSQICPGGETNIV